MNSELRSEDLEEDMTLRGVIWQWPCKGIISGLRLQMITASVIRNESYGLFE